MTSTPYRSPPQSPLPTEPKPGRLASWLWSRLLWPGEWRAQAGRWVWVGYRPRWPGDDEPFDATLE